MSLAPLTLIPEYFGSLVFDRRTSRYLPFDCDATTLFRSLKLAPFGEVRLAAKDENARQDLDGFFEYFRAMGYFTIDHRFAGSILEIPAPADRLTGPLAVHLEIVAACNLSCLHCFAGELPRKEAPLTLQELDRLFAQMSRMGSYRLGLTGGEPLLRKDLFELLDLATSHGLCPCLTTNGLLITEEIARKLGERNLVWLNVSLEGAHAETNDRIRGRGTFEGVLEKLAILSRYARFTLAFTIMRTNLHEIESCVRLAKEVGAETAVFRPLYPVGVARDHLELMPTFAEYSEAMESLAGWTDDLGYDLRQIESFGPQSKHASRAIVHDNFGCGAGNLVCSISVSGDVNPCSFLGPEFASGNLRRQSLSEIWHTGRSFVEIRGLPGDESGTANFNGGCRARSLVFGGSHNAPDPWIVEHDRLPAHRNPLVVLEVNAGGARR